MIAPEAISPGQVPEYECREVAAFVHVPWRDWITTLTAYERACAVAHYRTQILVKSHIDDASERVAKRAAARNARRRRTRSAE